jgi:hypothetical protein
MQRFERRDLAQEALRPPWWADVAMWAVILAAGVAVSYCSHTFWWEVPLTPWT